MTSVTMVKRRAPFTYYSSPVVYTAMKWIFHGLIRILFRYHIQGIENIPLTGRLIIIANHLHIVDPGLIMPVVPRKIVTMAKSEWRGNVLWGFILRLAGVIFVRRGEADRDALRACSDVLEHEGALGLSPEGTRSRTGGLIQAKSGIAYIATRSNAPILPIAIWGLEQSKGWNPFNRPQCRVIIGKPFRLPRGQEKMSAEELQQLADLTMIRLGLLLPPNYRGIYAERIAAVENGTSNELAPLIDI
jgi:1-acyl-sn-glycerol-3-phosphate acyltransferase